MRANAGPTAPDSSGGPWYRTVPRGAGGPADRSAHDELDEAGRVRLVRCTGCRWLGLHGANHAALTGYDFRHCVDRDALPGSGLPPPRCSHTRSPQPGVRNACRRCGIVLHALGRHGKSCRGSSSPTPSRSGSGCLALRPEPPESSARSAGASVQGCPRRSAGCFCAVIVSGATLRAGPVQVGGLRSRSRGYRLASAALIVSSVSGLWRRGVRSLAGGTVPFAVHCGVLRRDPHRHGESRAGRPRCSSIVFWRGCSRRCGNRPGSCRPRGIRDLLPAAACSR